MKERLKLKIWKACERDYKKALATYGINRLLEIRHAAWALKSDDTYYYKSVNGGAIKKRRI